MNTKKRLIIAMAAFFLLGSILPASLGGSSAHAGDDHIPFFIGLRGLPNVMFIFDNSNSMQDVAYPKDDGSTYYSWLPWQYGPDADPDGTLVACAVSADCNATTSYCTSNICMNRTKYVTESNEMVLPAQLPAAIPGVGGLQSVITSRNGNSAYWDRIYDTNVNWSSMTDDFFRQHYQYRLVKITDRLGNVQYRTLESYSSSSRYWQVYNNYCDGNIDYTGYVPANPWTYEIIAGNPGEVTFCYNSSNSRVYDANLDWAAISAPPDNYTNRLLVVTAGTNAGESRRITSFDNSFPYNKYWSLASAFPAPCDRSTRYKIVGEPDDMRYASGGSHPASKLYQAKQAMNIFLNSDKLQTCVEADANGTCITSEYVINMAFATYMSARISRIMARYYRLVAGTEITTPDRYLASGTYKTQSDTSSEF
jgi:hypothetical protein